MTSSTDRHSSGLSARALWLAYVVGAFGLGFLHQVNFLVPLRARELGASLQVIGLIVGAASLVPVAVSLPFGRLIDRMGPRRGFLVGTSLTALAALAFITVTDYWMMLVLQLVLGAVWTLAWLASQSYITSLSSGRSRAAMAGKFSFFTNLGTMLGPLLAGLVAQLVGFRWAFAWLAFYALAFAVIGVGLADARGSGSRRDGAGQADAGQGGVGQGGAGQDNGFRAAARMLRVRAIQVAMVLTFVRLWNEFVWTSFFPVHLVDIGFAPGLVGTVVFAKGLVATLLAPTVGAWTRFMSRETVATVGLALGATGVLLSPHFAVLPWVYLPAILVGVGAGVSLPLLLAIVSDAVPAGQRGLALGLRMTVNQVAAGTAPMVVGPLMAALGVISGFAAAGLFTGSLLAVAAVRHHTAPVAQRAGTGRRH